jgi:hypothetical protein
MSDTMKKIDFDDTVAKLADRTAMITGTLNLLLDAWGFDLESRRPGVAYVDENGIPVTDLDLACFMMALVERRAVITLPHYKGLRAATVREGERVTSAENRHGRITGLTSNQSVPSFGIMVDDANVTVQHDDGSEDIGAYRNFLLQGFDGKWNPGWDVIELKPFGLDKEVFEALSNATKVLKFKYFIHPLRWPSFYGRPHLLAMLADERISDEMKFLNSEAKRIREALSIPPKVWPKSAKVSESVPQKFLAFEAEVDGFELKGEYVPYPTTQEGLDQVTAKLKRYRQLQGQIRFQYRATQFAFLQEALKKQIPEDQLIDWLAGQGDQEPRKPAWMKDKTWERYLIKKTPWAKIEIVPGFYLRFRVRYKTEQVAA